MTPKQLAKILSENLRIAINTDNPVQKPGPYIVTLPNGDKINTDNLDELAKAHHLDAAKLKSIVNQGFYCGYSVKAK